MKRFILASGSPRRREMIDLYREKYEMITSDVDETIPEGTPAGEAVVMLARKKAEAVARSVCDPDAVILAADTVVAIDGKILGKPADDADAYDMLSTLRGRTHVVYSGVCVICGDKIRCGCEATEVTMGNFSDESLKKYISCGECSDKAGGYAIQGRAGVFVERINGSYHNVVGLPIALVDKLLRDMGQDGLI